MYFANVVCCLVFFHQIFVERVAEKNIRKTNRQSVVESVATKTMEEGVISEAEVANVREGIVHDVRCDGRPCVQFRDVLVKPGAVPHAAGSARVDIGGTAVVASISCQVVEEQQGTLAVHVDCVPVVSRVYAAMMQGGAQKFAGRSTFLSHVTVVLSRMLGAAGIEQADQGTVAAETIDEEGCDDGDVDDDVKTSTFRFHGIDYADLRVGEAHAFALTADIHIVQCTGGSAISACALALRAALQNLRLPEATVKEGPDGPSVEVDYASQQKRRVKCSEVPVLVAMRVAGSRYVVDPSLLEEAALPNALHVGVCDSGSVAFVENVVYPSRIGSRGSLSVGDLRSALQDAVELAKGLIVTLEQTADSNDE